MGRGPYVAYNVLVVVDSLANWLSWLFEATLYR